MSDGSVYITDVLPGEENLQLECGKQKTNLSNHKSFANQADLDNHLLLLSHDPRHLVCNQDTRTYSQKDQLRSHQATHLVAVPYACKSFPKENRASHLPNADSRVAECYARKSFPKKNHNITPLTRSDNTFEVSASKRRYPCKSLTKRNEAVTPDKTEKVARSQDFPKPRVVLELPETVE